MSPAHVLAIDQGTTSTRALVLDQTGTAVAEARTRHRLSHPRPGWVEQDPEELWRAVRGCVAAVLERAGLRPGDLAGAGLANQRETTLLWERSTGRPVAPAIVWQDRRTAAACRALAGAAAAVGFEERTGLVLDPYFSATKLAWLLQHVPDAAVRAARGALCFGTVDTWIAFRASGGRRHVSEATNASRTGLVDLVSRRFDEALLELFAIPAEVLPVLVGDEEPLVEAEEATELVEGGGVGLLAGLGDQQAALLAQGCVASGQAKATFGTGTFVLGHCGARPPVRRAGLLATAAAPSGSGPAYALEGAVLSSGSAVAWLVDGLGILDSPAASEQLAAAGSAAADVWFVPALAGLGSPRWDPTARGTLLGVTGGTTAADVTRAVLEGIAHSTCDVLDAMASAGRPVKELRVDGGAAANGWLMTELCELAGVPVDVSAELESTALGSAYLAGIRAGLWRFDDLGELRRSRRRLEPTRAPAARSARRARWGEAVERALGWAAGEETAEG